MHFSSWNLIENIKSIYCWMENTCSYKSISEVNVLCLQRQNGRFTYPFGSIRYFIVSTHSISSLASFLKVTIYYKSLRSEASNLFLIKTILQIYDIHEKIYSIPRKILYTYFVCVAAEQLLLNLNTIFCYLFRQFVIQYLTFIIFV